MFSNHMIELDIETDCNTSNVDKKAELQKSKKSLIYFLINYKRTRRTVLERFIEDESCTKFG